MLIFSFCIFLLTIEFIFSVHSHKHNEEKIEDGWGHYRDGVHNSEYDHEAILGSKSKAQEYENLSPSQVKTRLQLLVTMKGGMDANHDGFVDKEELTDWILASFKTLAIEEAAERLIEEDLDKDGFVSWAEHFKNNFEPDDFEISDDMLVEDKILWKAADANQDDLLNVTEFAAFLSPEDFESMTESLYLLTMEKKDKNKDGLLDLNEFISDDNGQIPDSSSETFIIEKERFEKDFDINQDNKLDKEEILNWVAPESRSSAENEAYHLISTCDENDDGRLSVEEIVKNYNVFASSEATAFGESLSQMHDEL